MILIGLKAKRPFEGVAEFEVLGLPLGRIQNNPRSSTLKDSND